MLQWIKKIFSVSHFIEPSTAVDLIDEQLNRAELAYIQHLAAAETHNMLAAGYKSRIDRLVSLRTYQWVGVPKPTVDMVDPKVAFERAGR